MIRWRGMGRWWLGAPTGRVSADGYVEVRLASGCETWSPVYRSRVRDRGDLERLGPARGWVAASAIQGGGAA